MKVLMKAVKEKGRRNPVQSMTKLAKEHNVWEGMIRHLMEYDLRPSLGPG